MLPTNELTIVGKLQNLPEKIAGGGAALHILVENLAKTEGRIQPGWCRVSVFGGLADLSVSSLRKGDTLMLKGQLTLDKWRDRSTGAERSGLSLIATIIERLDPLVKPAERASVAQPEQKPSGLARSEPISVKPTPPRRSPPASAGGKPSTEPRVWHQVRGKMEERNSTWQAPIETMPRLGTLQRGDSLEDIFGKGLEQ